MCLIIVPIFGMWNVVCGIPFIPAYSFDGNLFLYFYPIFLAELLQWSPVLVRNTKPLGVAGTNVHVHLIIIIIHFHICQMKNNNI